MCGSSSLKAFWGGGVSFRRRRTILGDFLWYFRHFHPEYLYGFLFFEGTKIKMMTVFSVRGWNKTSMARKYKIINRWLQWFEWFLAVLPHAVECSSTSTSSLWFECSRLSSASGGSRPKTISRLLPEASIWWHGLSSWCCCLCRTGNKALIWQSGLTFIVKLRLLNFRRCRCEAQATNTGTNQQDVSFWAAMIALYSSCIAASCCIVCKIAKTSCCRLLRNLRIEGRTNKLYSTFRRFLKVDLRAGIHAVMCDRCSLCLFLCSLQDERMNETCILTKFTHMIYPKYA